MEAAPRRRRRRREHAVPQEMQIENVSIDDLHAYEFNPRDNEGAIESVMNSIREFRFLVPIVANEDGLIGAGHTRWEAARRLGMATVPVVRASHLSDEQLKQFRIIDNKTAELARWDIDLLADEITSLEASGLEWTDFGFTGDEIDSIVNLHSEDATAAADVNSRRDSSERTSRAPATTRIVVGEFTAFIPTAVYRQWANQIRAECNHNQDEITDHMMDLLGIAPYLVRDDGEGG